MKGSDLTGLPSHLYHPWSLSLLPGEQDFYKQKMALAYQLLCIKAGLHLLLPDL